jgi:hypothetical protein
MKLLYFAWLKTKIGTAEEELSPPPEVDTVAALLDWLGAAAAMPRRWPTATRSGSRSTWNTRAPRTRSGRTTRSPCSRR